MAFDSKGLDDYIDVAQRIAEFRVKHPEGSLQPLNPAQPFEIRDLAGTDKNGKEVRGTFIIYAAAAYRTPDDPRPGVGCAYEVFPGRTPYTAGSELQNAETAAWGRAIVAVLAADTRAGVASQQEVRNRQAERGQSAGDVFESAAPVPPRQADRQQPPPPSPEATDADAQVFADEAHKATVPARDRGHPQAVPVRPSKVAALIRNPSSGGVGKLAVYLDWKRKQLMAAPPVAAGLDPDDPWAAKVEELGDEDDAFAAISELADLLSDGKIDERPLPAGRGLPSRPASRQTAAEGAAA